MDEPLYPERHWWHAGDCGKQPLKDIVKWTQGGTFHRYGRTFIESHGDVDEALLLMCAHRALVEFTSTIARHYTLDWSLFAVRTGDPASRVLVRPHMTPEDAAYAALTLIEQDDREYYEQNLVVGFA